jgi:hypothetical protein
MSHLKNVLNVLESAEKEALHLRTDVEQWLAEK